MSYRLVEHLAFQNHGENNIVPRQEEPMTYRIVNLSYEVLKFTMTNPEKARTLARALIFIGIIGVGVWAISCI